jgi:Flp pilus assembly protein TadD
LDETSAEAHTSLGEVLKDYDWDWAGAESAYRHAIALNPNYSTARHFYAQLLVTLARYAEAAEQIELARRVDPLSPAINAFVPYIYLAARDYARAADEACRAVELEPRSPVAHWHFGRACLFFGDVSQALAELETASDLANRRPMWQAELCFARARAGDRSGAEAILSELTSLARNTSVSPYDLALCYVGLRDSAGALSHLELAYRERVMRIISIGDPELDDLRLEPRFASLVEGLRLPHRNA